MSVAGPSRARPPGLAQRGSIGSTYEDDLHELLNHLSLDEMNEMQAFFTGRASAGERLSDHDLAMNDLLQQARALAVFNDDQVLAQRIANGEDIGDAPRTVPRVNNNRTTILGENRNRQAQATTNSDSSASSQTWRGWLSSVVGWVFGPKPPEPGTTTTNINGGVAPVKPSVNNRPTGHDCVICQDPIRGAEIRAPCGHYYDIECVTDLFQSATRDETLYPPRCCRQNIPFAQVQPHLSQALLTTFQQKQAEFGTLKRVYCSSPTCSRFLGPLSEGLFSSKVYTCSAPGCGRRTCGKCRARHSSDWTHVCRPDAGTTQVLELSRASGWARCPGCSQMIELHVGCFHMTCRCRTEFCYLCLARWKTCQCPQWDERRLLAAAEERVDAQLGRGLDRGVQRNAEPAHRVPPVPAPVPAPGPAPARRFAHIPANNAPANRARTGVPVLAPGTVQRPTPTPTATAARQSVVLPPHPQPGSVRTMVNTINSSARTANATPTLTVPMRTPIASSSVLASSRATPTTSTEARNPFASPATRAMPTSSTSGSRSGWARQPKPTSTVDTTRQLLVREMMERLREDHECDHIGRWRYRNGGGICQSCGHHLPIYLFRCLGCDMLACNRCRRNRL